MMKKAIAVVRCLLWTAAFAQNIPADSLDAYRKNAHRMLIGAGLATRDTDSGLGLTIFDSGS